MSFLYQDIISPGTNLPIVTPNSPEGKERLRWELPKSQGGMNRVGYEPYPKCLYRAGRPTQGNVLISGSCTVHDESEERIALGQGWSLTQADAIQRFHDTHVEMAKLAANRAYQELSMSEKAQQEAAAFEAETVQHVAEIPARPVRKKPGPKPKSIA